MPLWLLILLESSNARWGQSVVSESSLTQEMKRIATARISLYPFISVMDIYTKGGLTQFQQLFTVIPCTPNYFKSL